MSSLINLTDSDFEKVINESNVPVAIDFWAPWCGPCKALTPIFEDLSNELEGKAKFFKLNVDESPVTATKYSIMSIPSVLVFKNGQVEKQIIGLVGKDKLKKVIDSL